MLPHLHLHHHASNEHHHRHSGFHALSVGHSDFEEFLSKRLHALHLDLLKECNRIAVARELSLKQELENCKKRITELRHAKKIHMSEEPEDSNTRDIELCRGSQAVTPRASTSSTWNQYGAAEAIKEPPPKCPETVIATGSQAAGTGDRSKGSGISSTVQDIEGLRELPSANVQPSTDKLAVTGRESTVSRRSESQPHHEHFTLWTEWNDARCSVLPSVSDSELDWHMEDNALEKLWLNQIQFQHDHNDAHPCTFAPSSAFVLAWEVIGIPILLYDLTTIPLQVFHNSEGVAFAAIGWIVILYWTVDLWLRLLVFGYITTAGVVQLNRLQIMKHYLRFSFWFDLVMVAPDWVSICFGTPRNVSLLRTVRLLRLTRVLRISKLNMILRKIQDLADSDYFSVIVNILNNLCVVIGCCHYWACFWYWLGTTSISGIGWVDKAELEDSPWEYQYLVSMHFTLTQFTPGGSQVKPQNSVEFVVAMLILVFGLVVFASFISSLTQERMRLQKLANQMDKDNWTLRRYLRQNRVSMQLSVRVIRYVDACVAPLMQRVQRKDVALLNYLSRPLRLEVQAELYYHTLLKHPFLQCLKQWSLALISHLFTHAVVELSLAQTDVLFTVGQVAHEMFFVSRGMLAYLMRGSNEAGYVKMAEWCCEPVIWVPWVHKGTARAASDLCHLISIDSAKMRNAVLEHKERFYVRKCAKGYLNDINAYIDEGFTMSDIICFSNHESSEYLCAIYEEAPGTASSE